MRPRPLYPEVFLLALATILLEVAYTRVFSFKLVYYFTYVIIGLALLGLGSGAILVALVPALRRRVASGLVPACALGTGAAVLGGYLAVARTPLNAFRMIESLTPLELPVVAGEAAKLVLVCGAVFLPFLGAGIAIAAIFATCPERFNRLYFADLVGAGLACAAVIPLITAISPPGCVLLAGLVGTAAGVRLAARHTRALLAPMALVGGALLLGGRFPAVYPTPFPTG